jgi:phosphoglycerate dehydrogenase-like enzyme
MSDASGSHTATPRLVISDFGFEAPDREQLHAALGPDALLLVSGGDALREAMRAHPEADVLCTFFPSADTLDLLPNLRWIALPSAGADHVLRAGLVRPGGPIVTTANGVHSVPIGEFVFSMLLAWLRHWPQIVEAQRTSTWPPRPEWRQLTGRELYGNTLLVIGLGAIGRYVARLGRGFGMHVIATRRTAQPGAADPDANELLPMSRLHDALSRADFVVVSVPATPETYHLIGAAELRAMKPSALLVNIARGTIMDEPALIEALRAGEIGGAALDVFEHEPLAPDSPLWTMPNVIISPHISGSTDQYSRRFTDLFLDNLARYRTGQPMRNVVDPTRGY